MIQAYYDVIVVGVRIGTLAAAALLAKRGFRVLVIGQDAVPPEYELEGHVLPRGPFNFVTAHSPMARRIFAELAIHQGFRRQASAMDPAFQVALPGQRFDMAAETADLDRELDREFPAVKRSIETFFTRAGETNAALDRVLDTDLVWPPETFFERREHKSAIAHLAQLGLATDPLAELPEAHPFRHIVSAPVRFADGMDPDHPTALRTMRHFGAWQSGGAVLTDGLASLREMLEECCRSHGGELRLGDRIDALGIKRGSIQSVRIAASGEEIGATFVVLGSEIATFLRLLPDRRPFEELFERHGEPVIRYYRYAMNLVVDADAVPVGMARDVFFLRDPSRAPTTANLLHVEVRPPSGGDTRMLCVEALLPRRGVEDTSGWLESVREHLLASLGELIPFLGQNLRLVDSPHDGRPPLDVRRGIELETPMPWTRGRTSMEVIHGFPMTSVLGLCALPIRTPIRRLLLGGREVVPGLGLEGQLAAAWSVARVVSRSDKRPAVLRRGLWTKLEG